MNVLFQEWDSDGTFLSSISKDRSQLAQTIRALRKKCDYVYLTGRRREIELPDDHIFVGMVQNETVFLHRDEVDELNRL
jgi:hypothetical protein